MATIVGDKRSNRLRGTKFNDRIDGKEGSDRIFGLAGNDLLLAGDGDKGNDIVFGGDGNDLLYGGGGRDTLKGGAGDDRLYGRARKSTLECKSVTLEGEEGNDSLYGTKGRDLLKGGSGNDRLEGIEGSDTLEGGAGNDTLVISGYDKSVDILRGGTGDDTYLIQVRAAAESKTEKIIEGANEGIDQVITETRSWTLAENVENLQMDSTGNGTATGNAGDNIIHRDSLLASSNFKTLLGLGGNDTLIGGFGKDVLSGGEGSDRFVFDFGVSSSPNSFPPGYDLGVDTITDFVAGTDKIVLSRRTFTALSTNVGQNLGAEFASVANDSLAETSTAIIVFSQASQTLFYNSNGSSSGFGEALSPFGAKATPGAFAQVTGAATLTSSNFEVVASKLAII